MKPHTRVVLILLTTLLAACDSNISKEYLVDKYTDAASQFIGIQGSRVHYKDEGEGEVLVLIHGTASSLLTWDKWAQQLAQQFRVIRMDLPGFGLTGPDKADRYEVSDDIAFLHTFLKKLNVDQAHIVGSSLGGRIAWEYSIEHPQQVQTLTLINALGYAQESWPPAIHFAMLPGMETIMPKLSSRFIFSQSLYDIYFDQDLITEETIDRYFELSLFPGNAEAFPKRVKAKLDDQSEKIRLISKPTLILWGKEDKYFPVANAEKFARDIQDARLRVYEHVGHLPMEEVPDQSLEDLVSFIRSKS